MKNETVFTLDEIMELLPHRPPFLFVDRIVKFIPDKSIIAERVINPDEPHFAGHFPGIPIMPGVLITDALAQTSGLLWGFTKKVLQNHVSDKPEIFFLAAANMKYVHPAKPGDILLLSAAKDKSFGALFTYDVEATVGRNLIAKGSLTLAMKESLS